MFNIHREQRKRKKSQPGQRRKKPLRPHILIPRRALRMEPPMVHKHQIRQTTNNQPNPAHLRMAREATQHARRKHDEIRRDRRE